MVGIVSHDAGGAEILSSWALRCNEPYCLVLDGPAVGIFQRKLGECELTSLDDAVHQSDWLLCGTSWASSLERNAIMKGRMTGKKVIAYLDHWVNYRERFQCGETACYPDEIWVGDEYAYGIAASLIRNVPISLHDNPYVQDLKQRVKDTVQQGLTSGGKYIDRVLYVCEPIKEHALTQHGDERYWGYTEDDAMRYFFQYMRLLGLDAPSLRIRLHPSENIGKYDWVLNTLCPCDVTISKEPDLLNDILESDVVVGCTSMAMYVGVLAEKRVVSVIPEGGQACSIPAKEIEHLQVMVARSKGG